MIMIGGKKKMNMDFLTRSIISITLEYVYNDEEGKWLRLIANL